MTLPKVLVLAALSLPGSAAVLTFEGLGYYFESGSDSAFDSSTDTPVLLIAETTIGDYLIEAIGTAELCLDAYCAPGSGPLASPAILRLQGLRFTCTLNSGSCADLWISFGAAFTADTADPVAMSLAGSLTSTSADVTYSSEVIFGSTSVGNTAQFTLLPGTFATVHTPITGYDGANFSASLSATLALAAGQSLTLDPFTIQIGAHDDGNQVPEPATAGVVACAVTGILLLRRRVS